MAEANKLSESNQGLLTGAFADIIGDALHQGIYGETGKGPGNVNTPDPTTANNTGDDYGYGYGYGGYGSSGGGGSSGPSQAQKDAAAALGAVVGENADNLRDNYENMMDIYDVSDQQNQNLLNANLLIAKQQASADWFPQHLKLQRTASALNDRSGNAMRGSYLYDYRDTLATADDLIDTETLDTMRQNENAARLSYFEALAQNVLNRNESAADVEKGLRELYADYVAQVNNIHPDLAKDMVDTEGHKLNGVDWLDTSFFDEHRVEAAEPETAKLYRPDRANETARKQGLKNHGYNTASSAVGSYWDRMNRGYDQRERQA